MRGVAMNTPGRPSGRKRRVLISRIALLSAALAAIALYYGTTEFFIAQSGQRSVNVSRTPPGTGSVSSGSFAFSFFDQPRAVPELRLTDGEGRAHSLAAFRGKPLLLNIWATWCVPCREEMPSLDRLQAKLGASQLLVLPLSIDRQGLPVVRKFYAELGLASLGMYLDQSGKAASELNTVGIPTTLLIDRSGREIGRKVGPAKWDSPEIVALLRERLGLSTNGEKASR
ncbi:MAG: TlpA family protein disulfide reductase [Stellaceae bacterium]